MNGDLALYSAIAALEARARSAAGAPELVVMMANDLHPLLLFRQALVFAQPRQAWELAAVSGLARPAEDSPYLVWLRRMAAWLQAETDGHTQACWFTAAALPVERHDLLDGWQEWWPAGLWYVPLFRQSGAPLGHLCFLLDEPPAAALVAHLQRLFAGYAHDWDLLTREKRRWLPNISRRQQRIGLVVAAVLCLLPVRQTALGPAEVISLDAIAVASPLDGVVKAFHVRPNQAVVAGQPLFSLDDTTLASRLEIAQRSVLVADAELLSVTQKAFDNLQSKSEITLLNGRAQEKRAELAAITHQLARIDVLAVRDGVAVFGDINDWIGKPVVTGERILQLADPARLGVLVHLPVADAIALDEGAPVKLYLTTQPLAALSGEIFQTSYQATLSDEGIPSYRLRGRFSSPASDLRIGLRGTAKVSGGWVVLGYYLIRRPLAALRERLGV